nr:MAG TPA: hypothetical protein [Caudoviricetes sp.]
MTLYHKSKRLSIFFLSVPKCARFILHCNYTTFCPICQ